MSTRSCLRFRISNSNLKILLNNSIKSKISIHLRECPSIVNLINLTRLTLIHHAKRIMRINLPRALYPVCWTCLNIQNWLVIKHKFQIWANSLRTLSLWTREVIRREVPGSQTRPASQRKANALSFWECCGQSFQKRQGFQLLHSQHSCGLGSWGGFIGGNFNSSLSCGSSFL